MLSNYVIMTIFPDRHIVTNCAFNVSEEEAVAVFKHTAVAVYETQGGDLPSVMELHDLNRVDPYCLDPVFTINFE